MIRQKSLLLFISIVVFGLKFMAPWPSLAKGPLPLPGPLTPIPAPTPVPTPTPVSPAVVNPVTGSSTLEGVALTAEEGAVALVEESIIMRAAGAVASRLLPLFFILTLESDTPVRIKPEQEFSKVPVIPAPIPQLDPNPLVGPICEAQEERMCYQKQDPSVDNIVASKGGHRPGREPKKLPQPKLVPQPQPPPLSAPDPKAKRYPNQTCINEILDALMREKSRVCDDKLGRNCSNKEENLGKKMRDFYLVKNY